MASIDLFIVESDISLNSNREPVAVFGAACVAQDIRHMLIEEGYLTLFIGERNRVAISMLEKNIEIAIEDDERIDAGSASVNFKNNIVFATAKTVDDEPISLELEHGGF